MLMAPETTGPSHTGLDFIEDQQQVMTVSDVAQGGEIVRVGNDDSRFTLNGFNQDGRRVFTHRLFDRLGIVERDIFEPGGQGGESPLHLVLGGGGEGGQGAAMKPVVGGDDFITVALLAFMHGFAGKLDGRLIGFGTAVAEKHLFGEAGFGQCLGHLFLQGNAVKIAGMDQLSHLFADGGHDLGVAMSKVVDADAREKIQIGLSLIVPQGDPFTTHECDGETGIAGDDMGHLDHWEPVVFYLKRSKISFISSQTRSMQGQNHEMGKSIPEKIGLKWGTDQSGLLFCCVCCFGNFIACPIGNRCCTPFDEGIVSGRSVRFFWNRQASGCKTARFARCQNMIYRHRYGFKVFAMILPAMLSGCLTIAPDVPVVSSAAPVNNVKEPPLEQAVMAEPSEHIASMGGVHLDMAEFKGFLDRLPAHIRSRLLQDREALEWRVRWEVTKKQISHLAMNDALMIRSGALRKKKMAEEESLRSQYLASITTPQAHFPDQATLKRVYREQLEQSKSPMKVHLRQIFVPFGDNRDAARVKSGALLAMAKKPQADFAALARKLSMDPATAAQGGDMGWKAVESLPPAFKTGLKGVSDGQIIGPVETDQGCHIIQKVAEAAIAQKSFDEMATTLRKNLRQQQTAENMKKNLARWTEENPIILNPDGMVLLNHEFSNHDDSDTMDPNRIMQQKIAQSP